MKSIELKLIQSRIPKEMLEQIQSRAEVYGRSLSTEIKFLLVDGLATHKEFEFAKPKRK